MTIVINFSLSPTWNEPHVGNDLSSLDDVDFSYRYILGNVELKAGDCDFSAPWGWVPLLGFAREISMMMDLLAKSTDREVYEFTESEAELIFTQKDDRVCISSNYASGQICQPLPDLLSAMNQAYSRLCVEVERSWPTILKNEIYLQQYKFISA